MTTYRTGRIRATPIRIYERVKEAQSILENGVQGSRREAVNPEARGPESDAEYRKRLREQLARKRANLRCSNQSPPISSGNPMAVGGITTSHALCMKDPEHEGNHATILGNGKVWEWPR